MLKLKMNGNGGSGSTVSICVPLDGAPHLALFITPESGEDLTSLFAVGPALDAFGYSRIIFGTSPSPSSTSASNAHDWYTLVREVVAEVVVEQEGVDAIFGKTAQTVYGR